MLRPRQKGGLYNFTEEKNVAFLKVENDCLKIRFPSELRDLEHYMDGIWADICMSARKYVNMYLNYLGATPIKLAEIWKKYSFVQTEMNL